MILFYGLLSSIAAAIALPFGLAGALVSARWRKGLAERFGLGAKLGGPRVLVHLASVGEIISAAGLVNEFVGRRGEKGVLISVTTPTGYDEARRRFPGLAVRFFPADAGWIPAVWLRRAGVRRVVLFETELWPMFLLTCRALGVPTALVNARVSERSFPRYRLLRPMLGSLLTEFRVLTAQNEIYRERLISLGAAPDRVVVTGNVKFDAAGATPLPSASFRDVLDAFTAGRRLVVFASTHAGEEEAALAAVETLGAKHADAAFLIAPRHKERFERAWATVRERVPDAARRSTWDGAAPAPRVMLLDTLGELPACFYWAYAAFVGGSLVPVGGHNVLEPARQGIPVVFGKHAGNFQRETELLLDCGGAMQVDGAAELTTVLDRWLADRRAAREAGDAAKRAVLRNEGALARTVAGLAAAGFFEDS